MRSNILGLGVAAVTSTLVFRAAAQPLPDKAPVVGVLRDENGDPVPGAYVSIRRRDESGQYAFWGSEATTDEKGTFRFPTSEEGRYYLNADKSGYAQRLNIPVEWKKVDEPLKITIPRLAELKLRLTTSDGNLLQSKPVYVRFRGDGEGGQSYLRLTTDGTGVATLSRLVPANYRFMVLAEGAGTAVLNPGAVAYKAETPVFDLNLVPGGSLKVRVTEKGADGGAEKPVGGASLGLALQGQDVNRVPGMKSFAEPGENIAVLAAKLDGAALVSEDGTGTITLTDVPVGSYAAALQLSGWPKLANQDITINAGQTTEINWSFESKKEASLTLQVNGKGNTPLKGENFVIRMQALNRTEQSNFTFIPGINPYFPGSNARRGSTDAEGKLTLYPVVPGKYRIWVQPKRADLTGHGGAVSQEIEVPAEGKTVTVSMPNVAPKP